MAEGAGTFSQSACKTSGQHPELTVVLVDASIAACTEACWETCSSSQLDEHDFELIIVQSSMFPRSAHRRVA